MNCRILYLVGQLRSGGLERQLFFLLQSMDRQRYRPELVVWNFREEDPHVSQIRALGVPMHCLSEGSSRVAKLMAFRQMVLQIKPALVHSYSFYTNFAAWWATIGTGSIPIGAVQSSLDWAKKGEGAWLGRLSARWPRHQIFNSFAAAAEARCSNSPFVARNVIVVRNGLDLQGFRMISTPTAGRVRIAGIGSLFDYKRWDRLVTAARSLKEEGLDFRVQVAGDGPLREALKHQAQELGVGDFVDFIGHVRDIPSFLAGATFLVHTSDTEGCPNVVMEAMACGRAVVATDVGDIPSLIDDGKTGFVVRCGDDVMLADRMARLIRDYGLCCHMGDAGRAKAEREFGVNRLVSETLAAYSFAGLEGA